MSFGNRPQRDAFTLIELLVVIALILIIAALGVAFLPGIGDTARQAQAASMLQQWILTAKQKAIRDQVPAGLRINAVAVIDPATKKAGLIQARQCQYISQPDDFAFPPSSPIGKLSGTANVTAVTIDTPIVNQISIGDYLEILGVGQVYKIANIRMTATTTTLILGQQTPLPYNINPTKNWRIIRTPRLTGDEALVLPDPVMIDLNTNARFGSSLPTPNPDGSYDILFSPSGAVISPGVTTDSINLWVRDASTVAASNTDGEQTILAIYVNSGLVAAHPPAPGIDPYAFIKSGRSSGR
jgi:prepilin-type N-terminal cleavage/methylation domain-containing protein